MLTLPASERAVAEDRICPADRHPVPLLAEAREAGVDYALLIAAANQALRRRYRTGLPLWWTLLASVPALPGEPWSIESLRVDNFFRGYLGVVVRAVLNTADQAIDREDLLRILAINYARQVLASSPDVRIEPIACGFNLLHPDGTGAFVGRRFDASETQDARLSAIAKQLTDLGDRSGVSIRLKRTWNNDHVADYRSRVFGHEHTLYRLTLTVTGAAQDSAAGRQLHAEIVDLVHSHDAHEGFRTVERDPSERRLALHYAAHVVFSPC